MPATTPWFPGAQVPLTYTNTGPDGAPADASEVGLVVATVIAPDQTTSQPDVSHTGSAGSGQYKASYTTTQPGHHIVVWVCTDATVPGAFSDSFEVQPGADATIVSQAEAKEILHQTATTANDAKIAGYNASVTNWVEYVCGPVIVQTVVEKLPARGVMQVLSRPPVMQLLPWTTIPDDLAAAAGFTVPDPPSPMFPSMIFGVPYALDQLGCDTTRGIVTHTSGLPFIYGSYYWQYQAGRPIIPACIYEASKIVLKHLYYVEAGGTGSGTGSGDEETTATPFGFSVPNRAIELLLPEMAASRMVAL
jgi:hypothetical protein